MALRPSTIVSLAVAIVSAMLVDLSAQTVTAPTRAAAGLTAAAVPSAAQLASQRRVAAQLPTVYAPTRPRVVTPRYPWKSNIVTTVFWVGEGVGITGVCNTKSSWDTNWQVTFGGFDNPDPTSRNWDFRPKAFVPGLNPFYVALPFNDQSNQAIASAVIPWFKSHPNRNKGSVCHNVWIAIRFGKKICYAQWSDVGPFVTDDWAYVFGSSPQPKTAGNNGAGLDVSPAVRDFLGLYSGSRTDWRFCDVSEVPDGPWRRYGSNNPFAKSQDKELSERIKSLEQLEKQRMEWLRSVRSNPFMPVN